MDIFTLGDVELVREALFALATFFNSVGWSSASGFGMGPNFLFAALVGLIAILIQGITEQSFRVHYLLMVFILFGVFFGVKVDVNLEDYQTGEIAIVDDVPIGVAFIASTSSNVAMALTEDISLAIQRPGVSTSLLSNGGFLSPIRALLALKELQLGAVDPWLHQSIMNYYATCVDASINAGTFILKDYEQSVDPGAYLFNDTFVGNWATQYWDAANPGGVATGCQTVNDILLARLDTVSTSSFAGMQMEVRSKYGPLETGIPIGSGDIDSYVDSIFQGSVLSLQFTKSLFLHNLHNEGNAYRIATYGSTESIYVAEMTDAFNGDQANAAIQGTTYLQTMFPTMVFMQFLFFMTAPLVVIVMMCYPQGAMRLLGGYLTFGVWSYSWMPIAAVINHYTEISLMNDLFAAGLGAVGTGWTAIDNFGDFYNIAATHVGIGSKALAATPMITGAILTGAFFTVSKMSGSMTSTSSANTSMVSPVTSKVGAVQTHAGGSKFEANDTVLGSGSRVPINPMQETAYGALNQERKADTGYQIAKTRTSEKRASFRQSISSGYNTTESLLRKTELEQGVRQQIATSATSRLDGAKSESSSVALYNQLGTADRKAVEAYSDVGVGWNQVVKATAGVRGTQSGIEELSRSARDYVQHLASLAVSNAITSDESLSKQLSGEKELVEGISKAASTTKDAAEEYLNASREETAAKDIATILDGSSHKISMNTAGIAQRIVALNAEAHKGDNHRQLLRALALDSGYSSKEVDSLFKSLQNDFDSVGNPIGIDGSNDKLMDSVDYLSTALNYAERNFEDPKAKDLFKNLLQSADLGSLNSASEGTNPGLNVKKTQEQLASKTSSLSTVDSMSENIKSDVRQGKSQLQSQRDAVRGMFNYMHGEADIGARTTKGQQLIREGQAANQYGKEATMEAAGRHSQANKTIKSSMQRKESAVKSGIGYGAISLLSKTPGYTQELTDKQKETFSENVTPLYEQFSGMNSDWSSGSFNQGLGLMRELDMHVGNLLGQDYNNSEGMYSSLISENGYTPKMASAYVLSQTGIEKDGFGEYLMAASPAGALLSESATRQYKSAESKFVKDSPLSRSEARKPGETRAARQNAYAKTTSAKVLKAIKFAGPAASIASAGVGFAMMHAERNEMHQLNDQDWINELDGSFKLESDLKGKNDGSDDYKRFQQQLTDQGMQTSNMSYPQYIQELERFFNNGVAPSFGVIKSFEPVNDGQNAKKQFTMEDTAARFSAIFDDVEYLPPANK